jgi:hypothetical protein
LCLRGNEFSIEDSSSVAAGGSVISRYNWVFEHGVSSSTAIPSTQVGVGVHKVKYSSVGVKTVRLTVKDTNGCWDTAYKKLEVLAHPVAKLKVDKSKQCLRGNEFGFEDNSSTAVSGSSLKTYKWIFDQGSSTSSAKPDTADGKGVHKVKYDTVGSKTVQYRIMDNNGCWDTVKTTVEVLAHPIAKLSVDTSKQCLRGNEFSYRGSSSTAVGGSTLSRYNWIFDFGSSTPSATPSTISGVGSHKVKYSSSGVKTARLTVKDTNGCWDTITSKIEVLAHPVAKMTVNKDTQCLRGNEFLFRDTSSAVSGSKISRYNWSFDTGSAPGTAVGRGAFYHKVKYQYAGGRSIRLTVKDTNGCWDTAYKKISVNSHPLAQIKIAGQSLCYRGNEYKFEDSSSVSVRKINSYVWAFGKNANISTATGIGAHKIKYSDTGKSIIVLIVKDDNGCSDTTKRNI